MKYALTLLVLITTNLFAQTGVFYDNARDGEGITAYDDGERLVFFFYTYGAESCVEIGTVPVTDTQCAIAVAEDEQCETVTVSATAECPDNLCSPVTVSTTKTICAVASDTQTECATATVDVPSLACDHDGQRFFLAADAWDGIRSSGILYESQGTGWPDGIPNPGLWDGKFVGESFPVGLYQMDWDGEGYSLSIVPFGEGIPSDPLYSLYTFNTLLFRPN